MTDTTIDPLRSLVGRSNVITDSDMRAGYEVDWTGRYHGTCEAVVRPASTAEVAAVLRHCTASGIAVVPQAGNSGLVGGGVPRAAASPRPTIVLSLRRLDHLGPVDVGSMQVTTGAGVTLAAWRNHSRAAGCDVPVDFAAREVATIGGAIATNAGGSRVLRFGTMRRQVMGIEAVLADGAIIGSLAGLPKETAGLHWPSLLCGSEGTLAVITAARLRVVPSFARTVTAALALSSMDDAVALLADLRRHVPALDAAEFLQPPAMRLVSEHLGRASPVPAADGGTIMIVDCAAHADPTDQLTAVVGDARGIIDAVVTADPFQRQRLLEFRDRLTEAIASAATSTGRPTFKLDVAVPLSSLGEIIEMAEQAATEDGARLIAFGHLAEGNAHLNVLDATDPSSIAESVLGTVAELHGTISAEHGIGIAKADWLHLIRSPADLAAQRSIKHALDPTGILNPGVLGR